MVVEALRAIGLEAGRADDGSVVAVIEGARPGPTVLLRADMDGLPLHGGHRPRVRVGDRRRDARLRPRHARRDAPGRRAAARWSAATSSPGRVLLMFQPGEEGYHGARFMLEEGLLGTARRRRPWPAPSRSTSAPVPERTTSTSDRAPMMAAADTIRLTVRRPRRPRLRAAPRARPDPGRGRDRPRAPGDGRRGRSTSSTRPSSRSRASAAGTTQQHHPGDRAPRGDDPDGLGEDRGRHARGSRGWSEGVCAAHGATADLEIVPWLPGDGQRPGLHGVGRAGIGRGRWSGDEAVVDAAAPIMGAEDFSYVLQRVPGRDGLPRRPPADRGPGDGARRTTRTGSSSTSRRWPSGWRCTRRWRSGILQAADRDRP